jgi:hypothetical protein
MEKISNLKIPIKFVYGGIEYNFQLENQDNSGDFWTSFESNDNLFDVHYCEDYNSIVIYLVDKETQKADYSVTIHSQKIV